MYILLCEAEKLNKCIYSHFRPLLQYHSYASAQNHKNITKHKDTYHNHTCTQELPTQQESAKVVIIGALGTSATAPSTVDVPRLIYR